MKFNRNTQSPGNSPLPENSHRMTVLHNRGLCIMRIGYCLRIIKITLLRIIFLYKLKLFYTGWSNTHTTWLLKRKSYPERNYYRKREKQSDYDTNEKKITLKREKKWEKRRSLSTKRIKKKDCDLTSRIYIAFILFAL